MGKKDKNLTIKEISFIKEINLFYFNLNTNKIIGKVRSRRLQNLLTNYYHNIKDDNHEFVMNELNIIFNKAKEIKVAQ
jgi:hypothetical protein